MTKVTPKEEKFCQQFVKCLNKTKSAIYAGYSQKSAKEIGYQLFTKLHIQTRVSEIREEIKEELGIDDHSVITELASLAFWNIKDFISSDNVIKDLSKLPKAKVRPVVGIKVKETTTTIGETVVKEVTTELKLADKKSALVDLGKHLGIFEEDNKQKKPVVSTPFNDSQVNEILKTLRETKTS